MFVNFLTTSKFWAGLIFNSVGLVFLGFGFMLLYEGIGAIWLDKDSTISSIVAERVSNNPHVALFWALVIGIVIGGLAVHFTKWTSGTLSR